MTYSESQRLGGLSGAARSDFLASRWLIRRALARATGQDANLVRPTEGRPDASDRPPGWRLSLSHSGGMAGCAVSRGTAIGLDIEPLNRRPQWHKVVKRWFTPEEQAWLLAENESEAFLKVWTLKEAWLKATGRGIANNLRTLRITPGFRLSGDRPDEHWQAALGQSANHLVAVVYQSAEAPEGFMTPGQVDIRNPGAEIPGTQPVRWLLHRAIHSASEPA